MSPPHHPSSYSALLRRSKLASYHPSIEQVYTSPSAHLARANFGLKRPLPSTSIRKGAATPFIRLNALDSPQRRTEWRKATKEYSFTKKWSEVVSTRSQGIATQQDYRTTVGRGGAGGGDGGAGADQGLQLQSRFVPRGTGTGTGTGTNNQAAPWSIKDLSSLTLTTATRPTMTTHRAPNFLLMSPAQFTAYVDQLARPERREAFRSFVAAELRKSSSSSSIAGEEEEQEGGAQQQTHSLDLYEHAQKNPTHLARIIERFLALALPLTAAPSTTTTTRRPPLPSPHPTLALQYSTPTPLETSLSPPIPGRLLGPSPSSSSSYTSSSYSNNNPRSQLYASLLSLVTPLSAAQSAGLPSTTFFPDASGLRSNAPGRAAFTLRPSINAMAYASRVDLASRNGDRPFRPSVAGYEPQVLAHKVVELGPTAVGPGAGAGAAAKRKVPGSQEYCGALPTPPSSAAARRSSLGLGGGGGFGLGLSELLPSVGRFNRSSGSGAGGGAGGQGQGQGQGGPRLDLYDGKRQSYAENQAKRRLARGLMEERRAVDSKVFGSGGGAGARKSSDSREASEGGREGKGKGKPPGQAKAQVKGQLEQHRRRELVDQLNDLLGPSAAREGKGEGKGEGGKK